MNCKCIHELFEEQVERTPEEVAVVFEDRWLTYRELNERANRLARHLQGLGVGPDTLVAICIERSLEMVAGLLGILKAGGAYVPLDPSYPTERLEFMLRDSAAVLLLTQQRLRDKLQVGRPKVRLLCLDADWETTARSLAENPESGAGPENLAYVIYTSGSTGQPKGVEIRHRSLANVLCSMARKPGFTRGDKLLAVTTISFDIAALELFLPLIAGGQVDVAPTSELRDGFALRRRLELSGATVMQATPATWAMLIEAGWSGNRELRALCGGEAVAAGLADGLLVRAKEVWNVYGPTETTIWSSFERLQRGHPITIGRPIANTKFYVVDKQGQLVPIGIPGELLIGGDGVARGYLRRPELTTERFIADPFSGDPGPRLYKTGDLVRRLASGAVEFLGRLDQQVKIRGFRIELGEIESALTAHPAVREAVVLAREDDPGDRRLTAYLTVNEGEPPKTSHLRDQLGAKLPEYMIPQTFVILNHFPLTPNGKVDRKSLPKPDVQSPIPCELAAQTTATEEALASIWRQVLGIGRVGLGDNFFQLGGHSLLAARVIGKINSMFQTNLSVGAIFLAPTVETLARAIEENLEDEDDGRARVYSLRSGHIGLPIYFMGAGAVEHRLAELIDNEHAVFALDLPIAPTWRRAIATGNLKALPSLEELGARFGENLRARGGSTPCVLAGYSFWGKVAFEAAHALIDAGGKVAYVVLVDAYATKVFHGGWRNVSRGAVHAIGESRNVATALSTAGRLLRWLCSRRTPYFSASESSHVLLTSPRPPRGLTVGDVNLRIMEERVRKEWVEDEWMRSLAPAIAGNFNPRALNARGVLIRTKLSGEESLPSQHLTNGWRDLFAQGLEVIEAPGSHVSMVRDSRNRLEVARAIESTLDRYGMANVS
jgi:amino acid adenylation domain-containing protein